MRVITAKISTEAAKHVVGTGRPVEHMVKELRAHGIPAIATHHGIGVERGTLETYEEVPDLGASLRVFEWTDVGGHHSITLPVEPRPEVEADMGPGLMDRVEDAEPEPESPIAIDIPPTKRKRRS
jgi:hypothetical protein